MPRRADVVPRRPHVSIPRRRDARLRTRSGSWPVRRYRCASISGLPSIPSVSATAGPRSKGYFDCLAFGIAVDAPIFREATQAMPEAGGRCGP